MAQHATMPLEPDELDPSDPEENPALHPDGEPMIAPAPGEAPALDDGDTD